MEPQRETKKQDMYIGGNELKEFIYFTIMEKYFYTLGMVIWKSQLNKTQLKMKKNDNNWLNNGITLADKNSHPQNIMDKYRIIYRDFGWYINIK